MSSGMGQQPGLSQDLNGDISLAERDPSHGASLPGHIRLLQGRCVPDKHPRQASPGLKGAPDGAGEGH